MVMFVHLAPESRAGLIKRNGIRRLRSPRKDLPRSVFATPVVRNFYASHQWLRELKRRNAGPIVGIYFRLDDNEIVWLGHYGQHYRQMSAAAAAGEFYAAQDSQGWEVLIPRAIQPKEICRIRALPQVIGWRFFPGAKGRPPYCTCKYCIRGDYGAKKLRKKYPPPDA